MPPSFSDLALAIYCPRKLYYRQREDDPEPPEDVRRIRDLAFRYDDLLAEPDELAEAPIAVTTTTYRTNLARAKARLDAWNSLADPPGRNVFLEGRNCQGVAQKILDDPLAPSIVSPGEPPPQGVWEPHTVKAVAAAKALAWEHKSRVETAFVEYPAHGVIREVPLTTRRRATFRRALRTARSIDGPPPRIRNRSKCESCAYQAECGVTTKTVESLL